jgi:glycosyltransferase involved in cell wall biosynthesis
MTCNPNSQSSVTVIIPAYNSENSLGQAVESVLSQNCESTEIIVVNDGSTDQTAEVTRSYKERIVYLEQSNAGQGAARNAGLKVATGEFIAFLDADDYWLPGFLECCTRFLVEHPEAVAVNTGLIVRLQDGTELIKPALITEPDAPAEPFVIDDFFSFWAEHDHVRTGSAVIRKSVIDKAGGQRADLRVSQDLEYWGYIATFGKWGYIPEPLWVGNSRSAACVQGWLKKYKKRRKLCPDVEQWENRIVPRLSPKQRANFEIVRGRVAMGYAQNKILGGFYRSANYIVKKYGDAMPVCSMSRLLKFGSRHGTVSWTLACLAVCLREWSKAMRLSLTNRLGGV